MPSKGPAANAKGPTSPARSRSNRRRGQTSGVCSSRKSTSCRSRFALCLFYGKSRTCRSTRPRRACQYPKRTYGRVCSAHGRCCGSRWRASSTWQPATSSTLEAIAAIASSQGFSRAAGLSRPRLLVLCRHTATTARTNSCRFGNAVDRRRI